MCEEEVEIELIQFERVVRCDEVEILSGDVLFHWMGKHDIALLEIF